MKTERQYPPVVISRRAEASLRSGHPWVYDTEIASADIAENGAVVDVLSDRGRYLGSGLWSAHSKIRVRLLTRNANDRIDRSFFRRGFSYAWDYRRAVMRSPEDLLCCRLIFGEADGFPGLTVDRFDDVLVTEVLSYGMEQRKEELYGELLGVLRESGQTVRGIYERNESPIRALEGLQCGSGWYGEAADARKTTVVITENGIKYNVDIVNGQKTGFFLDQKYNRAAIAPVARGRRVLDCFTHTGSFALNAAAAGAESVRAVDISATALECAAQNAALNGLSDRISFEKADVFDLLTGYDRDGVHDYDFIILDPPAFTKSRSTADAARRGYKEINYRAMKLLPRGGFLATCSCSHFMDERSFRAMLSEAAKDACVTLRLVEARTQAPDHPILPDVPETYYLKFFVFQVI